jgi:hypothetical protein
VILPLMGVALLHVCAWAATGAIAASAPIMAKVNTVRRPAVNCGGCLCCFMTVIQVEVQVDMRDCNDACYKATVM